LSHKITKVENLPLEVYYSVLALQIHLVVLKIKRTIRYCITENITSILDRTLQQHHAESDPDSLFLSYFFHDWSNNAHSGVWALHACNVDTSEGKRRAGVCGRKPGEESSYRSTKKDFS